MIDPNAIHTKILQVWQEYADAQDDADRAEEKRKSTFSALVIAYGEDAGSVAKAEHLARADEKYQSAVTKAQIAAHKANLARGAKAAAECWFEAVRSAESTKRQEMKL